MCGSVACDHDAQDEVRTIPVWMPAPNGPLIGVQLRERGLYGPHWNGHRVAFVPGAAGAKEDYLPLMERLVGTGEHRLFAVDQCGQNETPGVDDPAAYSLDSLAEDLAVAITAVCARKPVHLVGHGAGALVVAKAVARAATRQVARPSAFVSLTLLAPCWDGLAAAAKLGCCNSQQLAAVQHRGGVVPPPRAAAIQQRLERSHPMSLRRLSSAVAQQDLASQVRATGVPTLVVGGSEDTLVPQARTEELAGQLGARHAVVDQAGHLLYHDNPDGLARILVDFWNDKGEQPAPKARWTAH